jgi:hypothetical protein
MAMKKNCGGVATNVNYPDKRKEEINFVHPRIRPYIPSSEKL